MILDMMAGFFVQRNLKFKISNWIFPLAELRKERYPERWKIHWNVFFLAVKMSWKFPIFNQEKTSIFPYGVCFQNCFKKSFSNLLHPGRLTWNLQTTHLKRKMIFQTSIIMIHVNLPGCMFSWDAQPHQMVEAVVQVAVQQVVVESFHHSAPRFSPRGV